LEVGRDDRKIAEESFRWGTAPFQRMQGRFLVVVNFGSGQFNDARNSAWEGMIGKERAAVFLGRMTDVCLSGNSLPAFSKVSLFLQAGRVYGVGLKQLRLNL